MRYFSNIDCNGTQIHNINNLGEMREFTEQEVYDLFSMTEEEIAELTNIINNNIIAEGKLWDSKKTNEEIQNAISESKSYSEELIADISSITLEYVSSLDDVTDPSASTIYILETTNDSGTIVHSMNLWKISTSTWVSIGTVEDGMSFSNYYTKTETDELLSNKANNSETVKYDDIKTDITATDLTNTQVLGALVTKETLDSKIDKTSIVTTLDDSVTDEQVPSAKSVYTNLEAINLNGFNGIYAEYSTYAIDDMNDLYASGQYEVVWDTTSVLNFPPVSLGITRLRIKVEQLGSGLNMYRQEIEFQAGVVNQGIWYRNYIDGAWQTWKKLCYTTVEDVPFTKIDVDSSKFTTRNSASHIGYTVKNGICMVVISGIALVNMGTTIIVDSGFPNPINGYAPNIMQVEQNTTNPTNSAFILAQAGQLRLITNETGAYFYGTLTYPVAES